MRSGPSWLRYSFDIVIVQVTPRERSVHWSRRLCQKDSTGRRTCGLVQGVVGNDVGLYCNRFLDLIPKYCRTTLPNNMLRAHLTPASSSPRDRPMNKLPTRHNQTELMTYVYSSRLNRLPASLMRDLGGGIQCRVSQRSPCFFHADDRRPQD